MEVTAQNRLEDEAIGVVVNARDITERLQAQAAIRETEEQFRVAREIQHHLFPKEAPEVKGFDIAGARGQRRRPAAITLTTCRRVTDSWLSQWGMSADTALARRDACGRDPGLPATAHQKSSPLGRNPFTCKQHRRRGCREERFVTMLLVQAGCLNVFNRSLQCWALSWLRSRRAGKRKGETQADWHGTWSDAGRRIRDGKVLALGQGGHAYSAHRWLGGDNQWGRGNCSDRNE